MSWDYGRYSSYSSSEPKRHPRGKGRQRKRVFVFTISDLGETLEVKVNARGKKYAESVVKKYYPGCIIQKWRKEGAAFYSS